MATIMPKSFIQGVLIDEIGDVVPHHPYLAFGLISSGIEFLGCCIGRQEQEWDSWRDDFERKVGKRPFELAISERFEPKYHVLIDPPFNLSDRLRNGMLHLLTPKTGLGLTEVRHLTTHQRNPERHPLVDGNNVVLVVEYFYSDFAAACQIVIDRPFSDTDKMNRSQLQVPD